MSTTPHSLLARTTFAAGGVNANELIKVTDVKPWDSFRSVILRFCLQENRLPPALFAILIGRNNCHNNNTIEYYGFYNGLLLNCLLRKQIRHGNAQLDQLSKPIQKANSQSLAFEDPFPFEDLPSDVQGYCLHFLDIRHIVRLTQVSKKIRKIASLPTLWENISFYYNNKVVPNYSIIAISKAHYASSIKKLDLSLTRVNSAAIAEITSKCTNIKELILESCNDLTGGISPKCCNLEVLLLNGSLKFNQELGLIFQQKNTTLRSLGISHTANALANPEVISRLIGLRHLNMNYNRGAVNSRTIELCSNLPNLEALQMNWCPNGLDDNSLAPLTRCTTLTMLELAECRCAGTIIKTLCQRNNFKKLHLQELLSANYAAADVFNNSPQLESFYGVLQRGDYSFPKTLKVLAACIMWPEMLQRLVDNCPLLEYLEVRDTETKLENDMIAALKAGKLRNIRYLDIDGVAGPEIVTEVAHHCPNLEYLILTEKADVSLAQLQLVQEQCKNLREVSLKWRDEFSVLSYKFQGVVYKSTE